MTPRRLGRTGLFVSPICFGGNVFGWTLDEQQSFTILDAFVEGGGNFIDTADVYSRWAEGHHGGESEAILGRWMRERGNRDALIIATKGGSPMGEGPNWTGLSRRRIMQAVEASLRRLQTDTIDLYQTHRDDHNTQLDETLRALDDLVTQGKIRYIGASNYSAYRLTKALWESDRHRYARFETIQPRYNLVIRDQFERELEALCLAAGVGVIGYSSLASGFFSGKYRRDQPLPESKRAGGVQRTYMNERGFAILDAVEKVARDIGATSGQVAIAWLLARPAVTAPIASATSVAQVNELLGAAEITLPDEAITVLDEASRWD